MTKRSAATYLTVPIEAMPTPEAYEAALASSRAEAVIRLQGDTGLRDVSRAIIEHEAGHALAVTWQRTWTERAKK